MGGVHLHVAAAFCHPITGADAELDLLRFAGKLVVAGNAWQKTSGSEGDGSGREPDHFCPSFGPFLRKDSLRHDPRDWFSNGGLHGKKAGVARYPGGLSGAAAALIFSRRRAETRAQVFCSKCGARLTEGTAFCSVCGEPVGGPPIASGVPAAYAPPAIAPAGAVPAYPVAPMAVALPSPYAGFWLRVVAYLIDGIILGVIYGVLFLIGIAFVGDWVDGNHGARNAQRRCGTACGVFLDAYIYLVPLD